MNQYAVMAKVHASPGRPGELACRCPDCGCRTIVYLGEELCEGCAPPEAPGEVATDHAPCDPNCPGPAPHVGRDGTIAVEDAP